MNIKNNNILKVLILLFVSIGLSSTVSAATWSSNEYTWFSEAGDNDTYFQCHKGDTIKITSVTPYHVQDDKTSVLAHACSYGGLFEFTSGEWCKDAMFTAIKDGTYKIKVHDMYLDGPWNDKEYTVTVLK